MFFYMNNIEPKDISVLLKAVSSNVRLEILLYLISGEKCVCDIFKHLKLSQNLVSHHLGILRSNDLITPRKDGKWVHYSLNKKTFNQLIKFFKPFLLVKNKESKC